MPPEPHARRADDPGRLAADDAPAARSPAAGHEDALSPARVVRELSEEGRTERIGNNEPVANPVTSPPADPDGERLPEPPDGDVPGGPGGRGPVADPGTLR